MESIKPNDQNSNKRLFHFEFFSGIGGIREALTSLPNFLISHSIAFDININANLTYEYNYSLKPINCTIENYSLSNYETDIEKTFKKTNEKIPIIWSMSPPCQPFSRQGNSLGLNDNRSNAFKHLMAIFSKTKYPPDFCILENVKNFEISEANKMLIDLLNKREYEYRQFLLSPTQFNVPNSRLRFYLIAKRNKFNNEKLKSFKKDEIIKEIDELFKEDIGDKKNIGEFLDFDIKGEKNLKEFYLGKTVLYKESSRSMDIVLLENRSSNCFTKNYSRLFKGSGSVLMVDKEKYKIDLDLRTVEGYLRYFTPREILKFLCFGKEFEFPESLSIKAQYRLLGNSINVKVVRCLLKCLLND